MAQLPIGSTGQGISIINNKYRLQRRLGGGSFGDIYLGEYIPTNEKVAIKFEKHDARCPQLRHEYKVYRELQLCTGFGKVHHFGTHDCYNVMVMELLGYSLEDLFNKCGRRFSLKTVLQLADQVLERVETMHNRHLIHRDIKPANFVIGYHNTSLVHCIDFGLSKRYRHPRTLQHIPYRDGRSLTGTPRYASINNHLGIEQSRRDDLESIGYVLVYFLRGVLPWQGLKAKTASKKYKLIMEKKQSVTISELCQGCPMQFAEYLTYCRSLAFDSKPDMQYLRGLFRDLYIQNGFANQVSEWDWDRYIQPYGGLGIQADEPLKPPPAPNTASNRMQQQQQQPQPTNRADVMDLDNTPAKLVTSTTMGTAQVPSSDREVAMAVETKWKSQMASSAGQGHTIPLVDSSAVMMQTSDGPDETANASSPLNKLKQSLRISDDDNIARNHKRQLSLSQQGDTGDGNQVNAWGDYNKPNLGSRPKTAHGSRMAGRPNTNPMAYDYRGASSRPGTAGTTHCRKCGKATSGSSSTACGCGSSVPMAANHVVAGARGMMRYRRTRAATVEATPVTMENGGTTSSRTSGSRGGTKPGVSGLAGRSGAYGPASGANGGVGGGGGAKSSAVKGETFFNGVWRKAKSFARPTSASNLSSRRHSIAVNSNTSTGMGSQGSHPNNKSGRQPGSQSPMYSGAASGGGQRASSSSGARTKQQQQQQGGGQSVAQPPQQQQQGFGLFVPS